MMFHHVLPFGAEPQRDGTTRFRLWAPSCERITLQLPDSGHAMLAEPGGWHSLATAAPPGTPYQFVLPDGLHVPDPAARQQQSDVHGPSLVGDPCGYAWRNTDWQGRPWHEAVIYELHAGAMGGFAAIEARLPELKRLGITAVELMPVADFPGAHNWGYDGVLPFAPDTAYGTPDALKSLIDTAHGMGLMVFLDVVYNHFGPDGAYIHAFAKPFFREDVHTPWGAAIDFRRPEVCDFFTQNALYWLMEYRFDGLRFDAVHAISEESFLSGLAETIRGTAAPGRHVHLVLEHEHNRAALLPAPAFDAQWADDLHHCLHVLLTGENEGYYADFQDASALLAKCLTEGFAYQGQMVARLGYRRGEPSGHLPPTAFVMCLQNHDQIGNRAMGERLTVLTHPDALRAATSLLLLTPFIPMLFMGEEYASTTPFLFFTDHNEELAGLVREGRRSEFQHFAAFQNEASRARIPDPNAASTFAASVPQPSDPTHFGFVQHLLDVRRTHVVPGIPGCSSQGADILAEGAVRASWRLGQGSVLHVAVNLGRQSVAPALPGQLIFATDGAALDTLPPSSFAASVEA